MDMMDLVYSPPLEEEEYIPALDFSKQTIQYLIENKAKVIRLIYSLTRNMNSFNSSDAEDIYYDAIMYLFKANDYDLQKANAKSRNGAIVTLERYVNACIKCVVKRHITSTFKRNKGLIQNIIIDDEGKEDELIKQIADEKSSSAFENVGYDVKECFKNIEHIRYKYGVDIFLILYIRFLTIDRTDIEYRKILEVLGISKKKLSELVKYLTVDEGIMQVIKVITLCDNDLTILSALEEWVYGAKSIKLAINKVCFGK